jgi:hypothetical protein
MNITMAHSENGVVFRCMGTDTDRQLCKRDCVQYHDEMFHYCKQLRIME